MATIRELAELAGVSRGTVDRVLGWKNGEFVYDVTPGVFASKEEMEAEFVWNDFCGANFSKYLVAETGKAAHRASLRPREGLCRRRPLRRHDRRQEAQGRG